VASGAQDHAVRRITPPHGEFQDEMKQLAQNEASFARSDQAVLQYLELFLIDYGILNVEANARVGHDHRHTAKAHC
jgi:uncharacterized protein YdcH (DUF465 family)